MIKTWIGRLFGGKKASIGSHARLFGTSCHVLDNQVDWCPPRPAPHSFYQNISNQRLFFDWAAKNLGVDKMDKWYQIPSQRICGLGGEAIMKKHQYSMFRALRSNYPDHNWLPWLFSPIPTGLWSDEATQARFMEWLTQQLGINCLDDWYHISMDQLRPFGGDRMIHTKYGGSIIRALEHFYPQHAWYPWLFSRVAQNFWKDNQARRGFFDWAKEDLGLQTMDGWYDVTVDEIRSRGGSGLLYEFGDSLMGALFYVYPEHPWDLLKFHKMPQNFWSASRRRRLYFDWIGRQLGIKDMSDWYKISLSDFDSSGVDHRVRLGLLHGNIGSLAAALREVYPEHQWDPWMFLNAPAINQQELSGRPR